MYSPTSHLPVTTAHRAPTVAPPSEMQGASPISTDRLMQNYLSYVAMDEFERRMRRHDGNDNGGHTNNVSVREESTPRRPSPALVTRLLRIKQQRQQQEASREPVQEGPVREQEPARPQLAPAAMTASSYYTTPRQRPQPLEGSRTPASASGGEVPDRSLQQHDSMVASVMGPYSQRSAPYAMSEEGIVSTSFRTSTFDDHHHPQEQLQGHRHQRLGTEHSDQSQPLRPEPHSIGDINALIRLNRQLLEQGRAERRNAARARQRHEALHAELLGEIRQLQSQPHVSAGEQPVAPLPSLPRPQPRSRGLEQQAVPPQTTTTAEVRRTLVEEALPELRGAALASFRMLEQLESAPNVSNDSLRGLLEGAVTTMLPAGLTTVLRPQLTSRTPESAVTESAVLDSFNATICSFCATFEAELAAAVFLPPSPHPQGTTGVQTEAMEVELRAVAVDTLPLLGLRAMRLLLTTEVDPFTPQAALMTAAHDVFHSAGEANFWTLCCGLTCADVGTCPQDTPRALLVVTCAHVAAAAAVHRRAVRHCNNRSASMPEQPLVAGDSEGTFRRLPLALQIEALMHEEEDNVPHSALDAILSMKQQASQRRTGPDAGDSSTSRNEESHDTNALMPVVLTMNESLASPTVTGNTTVGDDPSVSTSTTLLLRQHQQQQRLHYSQPPRPPQLATATTSSDSASYNCAISSPLVPGVALATNPTNPPPTLPRRRSSQPPSFSADEYDSMTVLVSGLPTLATGARPAPGHLGEHYSNPLDGQSPPRTSGDTETTTTCSGSAATLVLFQQHETLSTLVASSADHGSALRGDSTGTCGVQEGPAEELNNSHRSHGADFVASESLLRSSSHTSTSGQQPTAHPSSAVFASSGSQPLSSGPPTITDDRVNDPAQEVRGYGQEEAATPSTQEAATLRDDQPLAPAQRRRHSKNPTRATASSRVTMPTLATFAPRVDADSTPAFLPALPSPSLQDELMNALAASPDSAPATGSQRFSCNGYDPAPSAASAATDSTLSAAVGTTVATSADGGASSYGGSLLSSRNGGFPRRQSHPTARSAAAIVLASDSDQTTDNDASACGDLTPAAGPAPAILVETPANTDPTPPPLLLPSPQVKGHVAPHPSSTTEPKSASSPPRKGVLPEPPTPRPQINAGLAEPTACDAVTTMTGTALSGAVLEASAAAPGGYGVGVAALAAAAAAAASQSPASSHGGSGALILVLGLSSRRASGASGITTVTSDSAADSGDHKMASVNDNSAPGHPDPRSPHRAGAHGAHPGDSADASFMLLSGATMDDRAFEEDEDDDDESSAGVGGGGSASRTTTDTILRLLLKQQHRLAAEATVPTAKTAAAASEKKPQRNVFTSESAATTKATSGAAAMAMTAASTSYSSQLLSASSSVGGNGHIEFMNLSSSTALDMAGGHSRTLLPAASMLASTTAVLGLSCLSTTAVAPSYTLPPTSATRALPPSPRAAPVPDRAAEGPSHSRVVQVGDAIGLSREDTDNSVPASPPSQQRPASAARQRSLRIYSVTRVAEAAVSDEPTAIDDNDTASSVSSDSDRAHTSTTASSILLVTSGPQRSKEQPKYIVADGVREESKPLEDTSGNVLGDALSAGADAMAQAPDSPRSHRHRRHHRNRARSRSHASRDGGGTDTDAHADSAAPTLSADKPQRTSRRASMIGSAAVALLAPSSLPATPMKRRLSLSAPRLHAGPAATEGSAPAPCLGSPLSTRRTPKGTAAETPSAPHGTRPRSGSRRGPPMEATDGIEGLGAVSGRTRSGTRGSDSTPVTRPRSASTNRAPTPVITGAGGAARRATSITPHRQHHSANDAGLATRAPASPRSRHVEQRADGAVDREAAEAQRLSLLALRETAVAIVDGSGVLRPASLALTPLETALPRHKTVPDDNPQTHRPTDTAGACLPKSLRRLLRRQQRYAAALPEVAVAKAPIAADHTSADRKIHEVDGSLAAAVDHSGLPEPFPGDFFLRERRRYRRIERRNAAAAKKITFSSKSTASETPPSTTTSIHAARCQQWYHTSPGADSDDGILLLGDESAAVAAASLWHRCNRAVAASASPQRFVIGPAAAPGAQSFVVIGGVEYPKWDAAGVRVDAARVALMKSLQLCLHFPYPALAAPSPLPQASASANIEGAGSSSTKSMVVLLGDSTTTAHGGDGHPPLQHNASTVAGRTPLGGAEGGGGVGWSSVTSGVMYASLGGSTTNLDNSSHSQFQRAAPTAAPAALSPVGAAAASHQTTPRWTPAHHNRRSSGGAGTAGQHRNYFFQQQQLQQQLQQHPSHLDGGENQEDPRQDYHDDERRKNSSNDSSCKKQHHSPVDDAGSDRQVLDATGTANGVPLAASSASMLVSGELSPMILELRPHQRANTPTATPTASVMTAGGSKTSLEHRRRPSSATGIGPARRSGASVASGASANGMSHRHEGTVAIAHDPAVVAAWPPPPARRTVLDLMAADERKLRRRVIKVVERAILAERQQREERLKAATADPLLVPARHHKKKHTGPEQTEASITQDRASNTSSTSSLVSSSSLCSSAAGSATSFLDLCGNAIDHRSASYVGSALDRDAAAAAAYATVKTSHTGTPNGSIPQPANTATGARTPNAATRATSKHTGPAAANRSPSPRLGPLGQSFGSLHAGSFAGTTHSTTLGAATPTITMRSAFNGSVTAAGSVGGALGSSAHHLLGSSLANLSVANASSVTTTGNNSVSLYVAGAPGASLILPPAGAHHPTFDRTLSAAGSSVVSRRTGLTSLVVAGNDTSDITTPLNQSGGRVANIGTASSVTSADNSEDCTDARPQPPQKRRVREGLCSMSSSILGAADVQPRRGSSSSPDRVSMDPTLSAAATLATNALAAAAASVAMDAVPVEPVTSGGILITAPQPHLSHPASHAPLRRRSRDDSAVDDRHRHVPVVTLLLADSPPTAAAPVPLELPSVAVPVGGTHSPGNAAAGLMWNSGERVNADDAVQSLGISIIQPAADGVSPQRLFAFGHALSPQDAAACHDRSMLSVASRAMMSTTMAMGGSSQHIDDGHTDALSFMSEAESEVTQGGHMATMLGSAVPLVAPPNAPMGPAASTVVSSVFSSGTARTGSSVISPNSVSCDPSNSGSRTPAVASTTAPSPQHTPVASPASHVPLGMASPLSQPQTAAILPTVKRSPLLERLVDASEASEGATPGVPHHLPVAPPRHSPLIFPDDVGICLVVSPPPVGPDDDAYDKDQDVEQVSSQVLSHHNSVSSSISSHGTPSVADGVGSRGAVGSGPYGNNDAEDAADSIASRSRAAILAAGTHEMPPSREERLLLLLRQQQQSAALPATVSVAMRPSRADILQAALQRAQPYRFRNVVAAATAAHSAIQEDSSTSSDDEDGEDEGANDVSAAVPIAAARTRTVSAGVAYCPVGDNYGGDDADYYDYDQDSATDDESEYGRERRPAAVVTYDLPPSSSVSYDDSSSSLGNYLPRTRERTPRPIDDEGEWDYEEEEEEADEEPEVSATSSSFSGSASYSTTCSCNECEAIRADRRQNDFDDQGASGMTNLPVLPAPAATPPPYDDAPRSVIVDFAPKGDLPVNPALTASAAIAAHRERIAAGGSSSGSHALSDGYAPNTDSLSTPNPTLDAMGQPGVTAAKTSGQRDAALPRKAALSWAGDVACTVVSSGDLNETLTGTTATTTTSTTNPSLLVAQHPPPPPPPFMQMHEATTDAKRSEKSSFSASSGPVTTSTTTVSSNSCLSSNAMAEPPAGYAARRPPREGGTQQEKDARRQRRRRRQANTDSGKCDAMPPQSQPRRDGGSDRSVAQGVAGLGPNSSGASLPAGLVSFHSITSATTSASVSRADGGTTSGSSRSHSGVSSGSRSSQRSLLSTSTAKTGSSASSIVPPLALGKLKRSTTTSGSSGGGNSANGSPFVGSIAAAGSISQPQLLPQPGSARGACLSASASTTGIVGAHLVVVPASARGRHSPRSPRVVDATVLPVSQRPQAVSVVVCPDQQPFALTGASEDVLLMPVFDSLASARGPATTTSADPIALTTVPVPSDAVLATPPAVAIARIGGSSPTATTVPATLPAPVDQRRISTDSLLTPLDTGRGQHSLPPHSHHHGAGYTNPRVHVTSALGVPTGVGLMGMLSVTGFGGMSTSIAGGNATSSTATSASLSTLGPSRAACSQSTVAFGASSGNGLGAFSPFDDLECRDELTPHDAEPVSEMTLPSGTGALPPRFVTGSDGAASRRIPRAGQSGSSSSMTGTTATLLSSTITGSSTTGSSVRDGSTTSTDLPPRQLPPQHTHHQLPTHPTPHQLLQPGVPNGSLASARGGSSSHSHSDSTASYFLGGSHATDDTAVPSVRSPLLVDMSAQDLTDATASFVDADEPSPGRAPGASSPAAATYLVPPLPPSPTSASTTAFPRRASPFTTSMAPPAVAVRPLSVGGTSLGAAASVLCWQQHRLRLRAAQKVPREPREMSADDAGDEAAFSERGVGGAAGRTTSTSSSGGNPPFRSAHHTTAPAPFPQSIRGSVDVVPFPVFFGDAARGSQFVGGGRGSIGYVSLADLTPQQREGIVFNASATMHTSNALSLRSNRMSYSIGAGAAGAASASLSQGAISVIGAGGFVVGLLALDQSSSLLAPVSVVEELTPMTTTDGAPSQPSILPPMASRPSEVGVLPPRAPFPVQPSPPHTPTCRGQDPLRDRPANDGLPSSSSSHSFGHATHTSGGSHTTGTTGLGSSTTPSNNGLVAGSPHHQESDQPCPFHHHEATSRRTSSPLDGPWSSAMPTTRPRRSLSDGSPPNEIPAAALTIDGGEIKKSHRHHHHGQRRNHRSRRDEPVVNEKPTPKTPAASSNTNSTSHTTTDSASPTGHASSSVVTNSSLEAAPTTSHSHEAPRSLTAGASSPSISLSSVSAAAAAVGTHHTSGPAGGSSSSTMTADASRSRSHSHSTSFSSPNYSPVASVSPRGDLDVILPSPASTTEDSTRPPQAASAKGCHHGASRSAGGHRRPTGKGPRKSSTEGAERRHKSRRADGSENPNASTSATSAIILKANAITSPHRHRHHRHAGSSSQGRQPPIDEAPTCVANSVLAPANRLHRQRPEGVLAAASTDDTPHPHATTGAVPIEGAGKGPLGRTSLSTPVMSPNTAKGPHAFPPYHGHHAPTSVTNANPPAISKPRLSSLPPSQVLNLLSMSSPSATSSSAVGQLPAPITGSSSFSLGNVPIVAMPLPPGGVDHDIHPTDDNPGLQHPVPPLVFGADNAANMRTLVMMMSGSVPAPDASFSLSSPPHTATATNTALVSNNGGTTEDAVVSRGGDAHTAEGPAGGGPHCSLLLPSALSSAPAQHPQAQQQHATLPPYVMSPVFSNNNSFTGAAGASISARSGATLSTQPNVIAPASMPVLGAGAATASNTAVASSGGLSNGSFSGLLSTAGIAAAAAAANSGNVSPGPAPAVGPPTPPTGGSFHHQFVALPAATTLTNTSVIVGGGASHSSGGSLPARNSPQGSSPTHHTSDHKGSPPASKQQQDADDAMMLEMMLGGAVATPSTASPPHHRQGHGHTAQPHPLAAGNAMNASFRRGGNNTSASGNSTSTGGSGLFRSNTQSNLRGLLSAHGGTPSAVTSPHQPSAHIHQNHNTATGMSRNGSMRVGAATFSGGAGGLATLLSSTTTTPQNTMGGSSSNTRVGGQEDFVSIPLADSISLNQSPLSALKQQSPPGSGRFFRTQQRQPAGSPSTPVLDRASPVQAAALSHPLQPPTTSTTSRDASTNSNSHGSAAAGAALSGGSRSSGGRPSSTSPHASQTSSDHKPDGKAEACPVDPIHVPYHANLLAMVEPGSPTASALSLGVSVTSQHQLLSSGNAAPPHNAGPALPLAPTASGVHRASYFYGASARQGGSTGAVPMYIHGFGGDVDDTMSTLSLNINQRAHTKHTHAVQAVEDEEGYRMVNDYILLQVAGSGQYGEVWIASHQCTNDMKAIKVIPRSRLRKRYQPGGGEGDHQRSNGDGAELLHEIAVMKKLHHKNIVPLEEVIDDPDEQFMYLVMPFIDKGSVLAINDAGTYGPPLLSIDTVRHYMRQVTAALVYLHRNNVIHCDIKPDNILLGVEDTVYLSDFGVSEIFKCGDDDEDENQNEAGTEKKKNAADSSSKTRMRSTNGTPAYAAPETLTGEYFDGKPVDMWALGVTLYVMVFGHHPYDGNCAAALFQSIRENNVQYAWCDPANPAAAAVSYDENVVSVMYSQHGLTVIPYAVAVSSLGEKDEARREHAKRRDAIHLIQCLLQTDPQRRPTAAECRQHRFLRKKGQAVPSTAPVAGSPPMDSLSPVGAAVPSTPLTTSVASQARSFEVVALPATPTVSIAPTAAAELPAQRLAQGSPARAARELHTTMSVAPVDPPHRTGRSPSSTPVASLLSTPLGGVQSQHKRNSGSSSQSSITAPRAPKAAPTDDLSLLEDVLGVPVTTSGTSPAAPLDQVDAIDEAKVSDDRKKRRRRRRVPPLEEAGAVTRTGSSVTASVRDAITSDDLLSSLSRRNPVQKMLSSTTGHSHGTSGAAASMSGGSPFASSASLHQHRVRAAQAVAHMSTSGSQQSLLAASSSSHVNSTSNSPHQTHLQPHLLSADSAHHHRRRVSRRPTISNLPPMDASTDLTNHAHSPQQPATSAAGYTSSPLSVKRRVSSYVEPPHLSTTGEGATSTSPAGPQFVSGSAAAVARLQRQQQRRQSAALTTITLTPYSLGAGCNTDLESSPRQLVTSPTNEVAAEVAPGPMLWSPPTPLSDGTVSSPPVRIATETPLAMFAAGGGLSAAGRNNSNGHSNSGSGTGSGFGSGWGGGSGGGSTSDDGRRAHSTDQLNPPSHHVVVPGGRDTVGTAPGSLSGSALLHPHHFLRSPSSSLGGPVTTTTATVSFGDSTNTVPRASESTSTAAPAVQHEPAPPASDDSPISGASRGGGLSAVRQHHLNYAQPPRGANEEGEFFAMHF